MAVFLLPDLNNNAGIQPSSSGKWEQTGIQDNLFLRELADGISVTNGGIAERIDSIPDIWARPILFQTALFANGGSEFDAARHGQALGEWRALLAMCALQEKYHLNLQAERVELGKPGGQLEQMLFSLAPKDSIMGNGRDDWSDVYVITVNQIPLAITSPTTLLIPAADYGKNLSNVLTQWPWSESENGRHLTDPITHLDPEECGDLESWLSKVKDQLIEKMTAADMVLKTTIPDYKPPAVRGNLLTALSDYIGAVNANAVATATETMDSAFNIAGHSVFCFLNKKIKPPTAMPENSYVRLLVGNARSASKPLLLVSLGMLNEISSTIPKEKLIVWPGIPAASINEADLADPSRTTIAGVSLGGTEWRSPEDFFTDYLFIPDGKETLQGVIETDSATLANADESLILPLKPELLEYYTPREIANNFSIVKSGSKTYEVRFTFRLSGRNNSVIKYTHKKVYGGGNVKYVNANVPNISIWPNFKRTGWNKYYLYYENNKAQNIRDGASEGYFYVYPWAYGKDIANGVPNPYVRNLYKMRLSDFPEVLLCTVNAALNGAIDPSPVEAGFVLIKEPPTIEVQTGRTWQVGIDFGTSSTMLYCRKGTGAPQPLSWQSHLFHVTDSGTLGGQAYRNFIPYVDDDGTPVQSGSFLSIFSLLNGEFTDHHIKPLLDGNIFWLTSAVDDCAKVFRDAKGSQIDANLKWKDDPDDKLKVAAYIEQICLQSLAEAAKDGATDISWNFSYPTAFSATQETTFNITCEDAAKDAEEDTGFNEGTTEHWIESQAGAYYFANLDGAQLGGGAVCLDIGAGTTDISVISGIAPKIVYHTSLQFAGRYLFRSIYKNYRMFAKNNALPQLDGTNGDGRTEALIDADMRLHSDEYLGNLKTAIGNQNVDRALQISQFAAAGIFYWLGMLLRDLKKRKIYEEDNVPTIYIGGNGARVFHWICGGRFNASNRQLSAIGKILVDASGLEGRCEFVLSNAPKIEVACGMVEDTPPDKADFFDKDAIAEAMFGKEGIDLLIANSVFAGDAFYLGRRSEDNLHQKTEYISAKDIKGDGVSLAGLELSSFVNKFNACRYIWNPRNPLTITDAQLKDVKRKVDGIFITQRKQIVMDIFVEPIFILELKKYMEML